jgi:hypothetical protein
VKLKSRCTVDEKQRIDKPYPPYVATERDLDQRLGKMPARQVEGPADAVAAPDAEPDVKACEKARNQQRTEPKNAAESGQP